MLEGTTRTLCKSMMVKLDAEFVALPSDEGDSRSGQGVVRRYSPATVELHNTRVPRRGIHSSEKLATRSHRRQFLAARVQILTWRSQAGQRVPTSTTFR